MTEPDPYIPELTVKALTRRELLVFVSDRGGAQTRLRLKRTTGNWRCDECGQQATCPHVRAAREWLAEHVDPALRSSGSDPAARRATPRRIY